jgi:hypothetical protein
MTALPYGSSVVFKYNSMELSTTRDIPSCLDTRFPAFYGTRRFNTEFTTALYPEPDQSSPHHPIPRLQDPS